LIKAITVRLFSPVTQSLDGFNEPIATETYEDVPGVLVYPTTGDAIVTDLQIYGKRSIYELCIPKGDDHQWEDAEVGFFGKKYHTFGPCIEYVEANTPTPWNKQIRCELIE
jgi:hypothetical protein